MERHSISCPEGDESAELISELRYRSDKAASQLLGSALRDVEICCDVNASEAKTRNETSKDKDSIRVWHDLDDPTWMSDTVI